MERLALDASVLVEYIIARSPYRGLVGEIFERAARGSLRNLSTASTL